MGRGLSRKYLYMVCADCGERTALAKNRLSRRTRARCRHCGSYALDIVSSEARKDMIEARDESEKPKYKKYMHQKKK